LIYRRINICSIYALVEIEEYELTIGGKSERITGLCSEIENLSPYSVYNVSVVAINNYGRSLRSYVCGRTDVASRYI
jgi:uncharacterized protein involved in tolerance to divalent cations